MARFSDGTEHTRRRDLLVRLLPPVPQVARRCGARANDYLRRRIGRVRHHADGPAAARPRCSRCALGLPPAAADRAATLTGILCDAVTPSLPPREGTEARR